MNISAQVPFFLNKTSRIFLIFKFKYFRNSSSKTYQSIIFEIRKENALNFELSVVMFSLDLEKFI